MNIIAAAKALFTPATLKTEEQKIKDAITHSSIGSRLLVTVAFAVMAALIALGRVHMSDNLVDAIVRITIAYMTCNTLSKTAFGYFNVIAPKADLVKPIV